MDDIGCKHKSTRDLSDENTHLSNKRFKEEEEEASDENLDPSSSASKSFSSNFRSATKSSPVSVKLLGEMGLGILDSDESNQSTLIGDAIANLAQPDSALSVIPSISSNDSSPAYGANEMFSESDDNENLSENASSDVDHISASETLSFSTLQSDSASNENSFVTTHLKDMKFHIHQDFTPANLVQFSRTNFRGIVNSAGNTTLESNVATSSVEGVVGQKPEGRAIRNTSMKKFNKGSGEVDSAKKHKGRSPLATMSCNSNAGKKPAPILEMDDVKKVTQPSVEDAFFMYQKRDPRIYTGEDNFARLSDEMILSVFKWLPKKALIRCSFVNHRFNCVAQDESLWTRLDLASKTVQPYALGRILSRGVVILRLAQSKILEPIFDPIETSRDFQTKLQYLDLSMAAIAPSGLIELFSRCRLLKKLSLEHVPLDDGVCKALAQNRKLEVLNLAMCTGLTTYGVRKLLTPLKLLHTLNISWTSLDAEAISEFSNVVNENLLRLNISGCRKTMSDESLKKIVRRCPLLRELDLSDCTVLTSRTIDILCTLNHLEYLSLSRCYNINVSEYYEINLIDSLAFLDLFGVLSEQALSVLANTLPNIGINKFRHSAVARPTVGNRRTSIWGLRTRD